MIITNYQNLLAIPYLTERDDFDAAIYATEPVVQLGKLLMQELVSYNERSPKILTSIKQNSKTVSTNNHKLIYTKDQVSTALHSVHSVSFGEPISVYGQVTVTAFSSGYNIGSSNWSIVGNAESVCYIGSSSSLNTHAKKIDWNGLKSSFKKKKMMAKEPQLYAKPDLLLEIFH